MYVRFLVLLVTVHVFVTFAAPIADSTTPPTTAPTPQRPGESESKNDAADVAPAYDIADDFPMTRPMTASEPNTASQHQMPSHPAWAHLFDSLFTGLQRFRESEKDTAHADEEEHTAEANPSQPSPVDASSPSPFSSLFAHFFSPVASTATMGVQPEQEEDARKEQAQHQARQVTVRTTSLPQRSFLHVQILQRPPCPRYRANSKARFGEGDDLAGSSSIHMQGPPPPPRWMPYPIYSKDEAEAEADDNEEDNEEDNEQEIRNTMRPFDGVHRHPHVAPFYLHHLHALESSVIVCAVAVFVLLFVLLCMLLCVRKVRSPSVAPAAASYQSMNQVVGKSVYV